MAGGLVYLNHKGFIPGIDLLNGNGFEFRVNISDHKIQSNIFTV
jgi:hypothetical protein